jgi:hypothetical protein
MQLRNRTYESSPAVTPVRKNKKSLVEMAKKLAREQAKMRAQEKASYYQQKKGFRLKKALGNEKSDNGNCNQMTPERKVFIQTMSTFLTYTNEQDRSTLEGKTQTILYVKEMYTYLNKEQAYISQFPNNHTHFVKVATQTARRIETQMDNIYENATQKTLTRSTKKLVSQLKTVIEETKTELHKWCKYSEYY